MLGDKRIVTVVRSWLEGKPTLRFGLVIVCIELAVLVAFTGVTVILSSSSKVEQAALVSRYPEEETTTTDVSTRAVSPGLVYEGSIARYTPVFEQKPVVGAVVVPSTTTKVNNVAQEPPSIPIVVANERQATTAEPLSSADDLTSPMSGEDLGFSEELLEEEEQPEEVADARAGIDVYARAW